MPTWIALLRGINVSGKNILPMSELTEILESLKCEQVATYIQSGNAVFQSRVKNARTVAGNLAAAIDARNGFKPQIVVLDHATLETIIDENPFPEATSVPTSLHVFFLESPPKSPNLDALNKIKAASEQFVLRRRAFYLHAPEGFGGSKLAVNVERHLGVAATARNWRTVEKLLEMVVD